MAIKLNSLSFLTVLGHLKIIHSPDRQIVICEVLQSSIELNQ
jgi:hypothetical protein